MGEALGRVERPIRCIIAVLCLSGCVHARWPAKTLTDGVPIASTPIAGTVEQLRALPRPPGVDGFSATRVVEERQVYTVAAQLLRFSLATDGDIHLAIAQPGNPQATMIAEIPDPARMGAAPERYRDEVARTRADFVRAFGKPEFGKWRTVNRPVVLTGPVFFDLIDGQIGGQAAGAPTAVEIHPVLRMSVAGKAIGTHAL